MSYKILLVDDELGMCHSLSEILDAEGYTTRYITDPLKTITILEQEDIDLVIMDIKMPQISGIDLLKAVKNEDRSLPVIMITGYPSIENAVNAMKYGALNFYVKPPNLDELLKEISQLESRRRERKGCSNLFKSKIITRNPKMLEILETVEKAAPTEASVLITGESGTGKEMVANFLHSMSDRNKKPYIKVNCAALPDTLLESELFGHEKGAFTDARHSKKGRFELADGGTIFLDEIGDMSLKTQAKILRVLQEHEFERVGGTKLIKTDIRVIAATNKDLNQLISNGHFRGDLYYRLSVIDIHLPPLEERKEDVHLLAEYFIENFNNIYSKRIQSISEEVAQFFFKHNWPGNVRELKNCIERAVILCDQTKITAKDLPSQYAEIIVSHADENYYETAYDNLDRQLILDALARSKGVKQKAAELLNIHRRTLYNRMKKLGLE